MQLVDMIIPRPTIVLVDDKAENLTVLKASLTRLDADFACFETGQEALEYLLEATSVALIFLDVQMPGMDGFEVAQLIRAREATKSIPIIFVTAMHKDENFVFKGYEAGAVDYLFKPLDMRLLRSKAQVFLDLYLQRMEILHQKDSLREYERGMIKQRYNANIAQFINGIAHNFNNLLAGVRGYGQLVQMHPKNAKMAAKAGEQIMEGVDKLSKTVDDLRNLILPHEHVDALVVGEELENALKLIQSSMSNRMKFSYVNENLDMTRVRMNRADFRASLSSLIVNAMEALQGVAAPEIKVQAQIAAGALQLSVADNGCGMDLQTKHKATVPLFSTKDSVGVGMGLAQVKSFCDAQGGEVGIESAPNEGTTVTMILPI